MSRKDVKQLPNPLHAHVITLPTEITCHRKVRLTDDTIKTHTKDISINCVMIIPTYSQNTPQTFEKQS